MIAFTLAVANNSDTIFIPTQIVVALISIVGIIGVGFFGWLVKIMLSLSKSTTQLHSRVATTESTLLSLANELSADRVQRATEDRAEKEALARKVEQQAAQLAQLTLATASTLAAKVATDRA